MINGLGSLGHFLRGRGRLDEAESCYKKALGLAETLEQKDRYYYCISDLAEVAQQRGDLRGALEGKLKSLEFYRSVQQHENICGGCVWVAWLAETLGDHAKAESLLLEVLDVREKTMNRAGMCDANRALGRHLMRMGRVQEAKDMLLIALTGHESIGAPGPIAGTELALALLAMDTGDHEDAGMRLKRSMEARSKLGEVTGVIETRTVMARLCRRMFLEEDSDTLWRQMFEDAKQLDSPAHWIALHRARGIDLVIVGQHSDALAEFRSALFIACKAGWRFDADYLTCLAANAAFDSGDDGSAAEMVIRIEPWVEQTGAVKHAAMLSGIRLRLAVRQGEAAAIKSALGTMEQRYSRIGGLPDFEDGPAVALLDVAEWHYKEGRGDDAATLARQALGASGFERWIRRERASTLAKEGAA